MNRSVIFLILPALLFIGFSGCQQDASTNNPGNVEVMVVRTGADYDSTAFYSSFPDTVAINTIAAEFRREYSEDRRARLIEHMLTRVISIGEDADLMRTILARVGCMTEGECIVPTYAERARFAGREAWMIQFTWGMGSADFGHYKRFAFSVPGLDTLCFARCR